ncbi:hypothetical protein [uncultured Campylobacter sp.]|uniref:hypothetical protein n=1 Tax=uncultured Campylobacter sp. TaxID=218934 RepID=UPI0026029438|nr:hypothetical protein [uncultured Campylobacter sp.]
MKFSRVEFYGDEYCARNSAVAKAQNSASCANYNVNFKIYIVKFCGARFGILSREISRRKISCCCKTAPAGLNLKSGAGSGLRQLEIKRDWRGFEGFVSGIFVGVFALLRGAI